MIYSPTSKGILMAEEHRDRSKDTVLDARRFFIWLIVPGLALTGVAILWMIVTVISSPEPKYSTQPSDRQTTALSDTCGLLTGHTPSDLEHLRMFCSRAISKELGITSARAMESLLWIKVARETADYMRKDHLATEQAVKTWLSAWRAASDSTVATVYVEWQDVEIARGQTTIFSGDVVTIR